MPKHSDYYNSEVERISEANRRMWDKDDRRVCWGSGVEQKYKNSSLPEDKAWVSDRIPIPLTKTPRDATALDATCNKLVTIDPPPVSSDSKKNLAGNATSSRDNSSQYGSFLETLYRDNVCTLCTC